MSMSLRDQLLKAGLVTEKQARQAEQQQREQHRKQPKAPKGKPPPALTPAASQAMAAKAARDQELNRRRQEQAAAKALSAQVRQLIEQYRVPRVESDDFFNFQDGPKIRRIPVDAVLRRRILQGDLLIARCEGHYDLVGKEVADRIRERDPAAIVVLPAAEPAGPAADDPYKDYVVPDDLTW